MNSKWRAPACYVGVGILCALYLSIVPGIRFTDVCAGAGLGAAVMWAINEWETGKWNVAPAGAASTGGGIRPASRPAGTGGDAAAFQAMAPAAAAKRPLPAPWFRPRRKAVRALPPTLPDPEPRERVDAGTATPEKMEKWGRSTRRRRAGTRPRWRKPGRSCAPSSRSTGRSVPPSRRTCRTAQLARNAPAMRPIASTSGTKPAASGAAVGQTGYTLGSLGKAGGSPVLNRLAGSSPSQPPVRKVASAAPEPARQPPPSCARARSGRAEPALPRTTKARTLSGPSAFFSPAVDGAHSSAE